jgi:hypothetical protein
MSIEALGKYRVVRLDDAEVYRVQSLVLVRHWFGRPPTEEWRPVMEHYGYDNVRYIEFNTYTKACAWVDKKLTELQEERARKTDSWSPVICNPVR